MNIEKTCFAALASLLLLALAPFSASASSKDGYYSHHLVPCATFTKHRGQPSDTENNAADRMYVAGWLSAYNYFTPDTYDIVGRSTIDTALQWLETYCAQQPESSLELGIAAYTQQAYPARLKALPATPAAR